MINTLQEALNLITTLIADQAGSGHCAEQCQEEGCPFDYPSYGCTKNGPDYDCQIYSARRWVWEHTPRNFPEHYAKPDVLSEEYDLVFLYGLDRDMQDLEKNGWHYMTKTEGEYPAIIAVHSETKIGRMCIDLCDTVEYASFSLENQREKEKEGWLRLGQPVNTTGPVIMMRYKEGIK
jgi:hypothetical protein